MLSTQRIIYCTNPDCSNPINSVGDSICTSCQTPIAHRYLWATGLSATEFKIGEKVADRYEVITPQIWLDTLPGRSPDIPEDVPEEIIPYLRLYHHRLHLPQVYGLVYLPIGHGNPIFLLENAPIDETGNLYPTIEDAWEQAKGVRQVYWLWQILQLWTPLSELRVAGSVLVPYNLRVQGWCVRLVQLVETRGNAPLHSTSLQQLGECWQPWVATAKTQVAKELEKIVQQMRSGEANLETVNSQLNALLLSSAAELPLMVRVSGATNIGSVVLPQNEDACYPTDSVDPDDPLLPHVSIVCDGIGGHEGGEVASQLAVQSLKLQIRALLAEVTEQTELAAPDLLQKQLEAILRVVNNVICNCNNEQNREGTQRMGTTVVMAVQPPQVVQTPSGWQSQNAHELYLASVGDSRAYWMTHHYCQLLTVDDDVAGREVRYGRSFYRKALERPDATALTQALGTKDGEFLRPSIQRFILEEDGILLLCSDGLSDNDWVEHSWQEFALPVLRGELSPEDAVAAWIDLANQKNAHDNVSVVLTLCRVSPDYLVPMTRSLLPVEIEQEEEQELTASAQALLDLDTTEASPAPGKKVQAPVKAQRRRFRWLWILGLLTVLVGGTGGGLFAWWKLSPQTFQQACQKLPLKVRGLCERE
ncbi:serine/threonine protein phosphatase [Scytonema hofmannii PCC 7110]|uniref:Serine/threonine protein phosphatase n=1 Tax=Scytonema hofmannii PCC 7110 TaxID=128403 RepID=A0A139WW36_9CYAN|nr:4-Cys prefix domain-containing protein [Scytonema hofmannii]KYC36649.1 serine/threonine protein phosphatase [Scytonema hofmannii PCC 7110]